MRALVHAELLKLRTRIAIGLVLATLALVCLTVSVSVPEAGDREAPIPIDDPTLFASAVGNSFGAPMVLVVLLGALAFTQEFRYGTVTPTYLAEPRRGRVLVAKWVSQALASVGISVATMIVAVPFSIVLIRARGGDVVVSAGFWKVVAAGFVVMVAYSVIGVSLGVLVRNQITVVAAVLAWMTAVEQILIGSFTSVGRWTPWGATNTVLDLARSIGLDGKLLSFPVAALLLLAYTALAAVLALALTPKRDVL